MVSTPVTEDYYLVLETSQTATPEVITKSYKRLALKLHPDRNARNGSTQAFQLVSCSHEDRMAISQSPLARSLTTCYRLMLTLNSAAWASLRDVEG